MDLVEGYMVGSEFEARVLYITPNTHHQHDEDTEGHQVEGPVQGSAGLAILVL